MQKLNNMLHIRVSLKNHQEPASRNKLNVTQPKLKSVSNVFLYITVMILSFRTDSPEQTV